jgi:hypothetical protein
MNETYLYVLVFTFIALSITNFYILNHERICLGPLGAKGPRGPSGDPGESLVGATGTRGVLGSSGAVGPSGIQGVRGPTGAAGTPYTAITSTGTASSAGGPGGPYALTFTPGVVTQSKRYLFNATFQFTGIFGGLLPVVGSRTVNFTINGPAEVYYVKQYEVPTSVNSGTPPLGGSYKYLYNLCFSFEAQSSGALTGTVISGNGFTLTSFTFLDPNIEGAVTFPYQLVELPN